MTVMFPTVVLDTTLNDLYRLDNESGYQPTLIHAPFQVHHRSPTTKFIYHSGLRVAAPIADNEAVVKLRLWTSPQRHLFAAGSMPAVIVISGQRDCELAANAVPFLPTEDFQKSVAVLPPDQRPIITFRADLDVSILSANSKVVLSRPTDCLEHLPHLIDPVVHYEILSKRGLAYSDLPSPPSTVIDTILLPHRLQDSATKSTEATRMASTLDSYKMPFVVKLPQSAGKGTFILWTEAQLSQLKKTLQLQLEHMLEQLTDANYDMHPCSLVLQDYISGKVVALSLFITRSGRPIFVGCCKQKFNDDGHWIGGSISYRHQNKFRERYADCMNQTAKFLHKKGYYGPCGIDILTSTSGKQYIIDLNARITGTFNLGLVTGHFAQRGLGKAMLNAAYFSCSRAEFEQHFAAELQEGRIIITAWTYDASIALSYGVFIIGGTDGPEIKQKLMQVLSHAVLDMDGVIEC
ncbi:hypothetical protein BGAL_0072g00180 [Botrytis galanthina]|uniref:ATP-grasp domain-containing protein n=1 Tax=Botrytis galanthina TaxID=278940 RepID=A0A4S8R701_9HELO|nr:hypothetical protein BGAL_0072g00180 [Botrytis galanthina]